jgi:serine-type D-Ala-D-Ala carboxypeptidase/endopeptidase
MKRSVILMWSVISILMNATMVQSSFPAPVASDEEIRRIIAQRVESKQSVGIVVGVIEPHGRRIFAYGRPAKGGLRPLNGETIFEIGSISKVFTSLLLADMSVRGEVALSDPANKYLPSRVKMPERGGTSITLQDLAMHISGLPRLPSNLNPKDPANPYADYSVEQLYQFLSTYQLTRDIGSQYEYSNLGGGLLGHILGLRANMSYEKLVQSRICEPLGMKSTGIKLSPEMKARLATGHNSSMVPVPYWDIPTLAGAGALRSDVNDMLNLLAANLGYTKSTLSPAMGTMLKETRPTGVPDLNIALGWHVFLRSGNEVVWHNGGTGGFRSFMGYAPKSRVGIVVLSNAFTTTGVDDIGQHLLDPSVPLIKPPKDHQAITVDPKIFDGYIGRYELAPSFAITISRDGDQFFAQGTGQRKVEIFPESDRDYFLKVVDAQITFETDSQGKATRLILHQNGANQPGKRIE